MDEITLHTGFPGDSMTIHVKWSDHNNVRHCTDVQLQMLDADKPRTLVVKVNDRRVYVSEAGKEIYGR